MRYILTVFAVLIFSGCVNKYGYQNGCNSSYQTQYQTQYQQNSNYYGEVLHASPTKKCNCDDKPTIDDVQFSYELQ